MGTYRRGPASLRRGRPLPWTRHPCKEKRERERKKKTQNKNKKNAQKLMLTMETISNFRKKIQYYRKREERNI